MAIPDVTAYRLDQAKDILEKYGAKFYYKEIVVPPLTGKKERPSDCSFKIYRILRQVEVGNNLIELTVAAEVP